VKNSYEKPRVETESVFTTLAAGCTFYVAADDAQCDPLSDPSFAELNSA
jgi:hypothetical protein